MRDFVDRLLILLLGIGLLARAGPSSAFARAGQVGHDDPWDSGHIASLPPEVRNAVIRMCGLPPHAAHYFATYFDHSRVIKLHFEYLRCGDEMRFCKQGTCLHQEYAETGGHYRLIKTYYGASND